MVTNMFRKAWHYFLVMMGMASREDAPGGAEESDPASRTQRAMRKGRREEQDLVAGTDAGWPESEGPAPPARQG